MPNQIFISMPLCNRMYTKLGENAEVDFPKYERLKLEIPYHYQKDPGSVMEFQRSLLKNPNLVYFRGGKMIYPLA